MSVSHSLHLHIFIFQVTFAYFDAVNLPGEMINCHHACDRANCFSTSSSLSLLGVRLRRLTGDMLKNILIILLDLTSNQL